MSGKVLDKLLHKYHYAKTHNLHVLYELECQKQSEQIDVNIYDILMLVDTNAIEIAFEKLNKSDFCVDSKLKLFEFLNKSANISTSFSSGIDKSRDLSSYIVFLKANIDELAKYLFDRFQVSSEELGKKLIDQRIKWLIDGSVDEDIIVELFNGYSLGLYETLSIISDITKLGDKTRIHKRLQTSSIEELHGMILGYLISTKTDWTVVGAHLVKFRFRATIKTDNEYKYNTCPNPYTKDKSLLSFGVDGLDDDDLKIKLEEVLQINLGTYEPDLKSWCNKVLTPSLLVISPMSIHIVSDIFNVSYDKPDFTKGNRENIKEEFNTQLMTLVDTLMRVK